MSRKRVLVLDADLPKRLSTDLRKRGRTAVSVYTLGWQGYLDPKLLVKLTETYGDDWVLATADDRMPYRHAAEISAATGAIATVDPRKPTDLHTDAWRRDIVHNWAERMQRQDRGSVYRYSMRSVKTWRPRAHYVLENPEGAA